MGAQGSMDGEGALRSFHSTVNATWGAPLGLGARAPKATSKSRTHEHRCLDPPPQPEVAACPRSAVCPREL